MTAPAEPVTTPDVDLDTLWHAEVPCAWGEPGRMDHLTHTHAEWLITVYPCAIGHMNGDQPIRDPICQVCVDWLEAQITDRRGDRALCLTCMHFITCPDDYYALRRL